MASLTSWLAMAKAEIEISTHREIDDASNNAGRDGEEKLDRLTSALARPAAASVGHGADFFFHFGRIHHDDGVPGAAIEDPRWLPLGRHRHGGYDRSGKRSRPHGLLKPQQGAPARW